MEFLDRVLHITRCRYGAGVVQTKLGARRRESAPLDQLALECSVRDVRDDGAPFAELGLQTGAKILFNGKLHFVCESLSIMRVAIVGVLIVLVHLHLVSVAVVLLQLGETKCEHELHEVLDAVANFCQVAPTDCGRWRIPELRLPLENSLADLTFEAAITLQETAHNRANVVPIARCTETTSQRRPRSTLPHAVLVTE